MVFGKFVFVRISDFACLHERVQLFVVYLHSYNYVLQKYFK